MRHLVPALLLSFLLLGGAVFAQQSGKPFIIIGTGEVTGVHYAAGQAIAKVFARDAGEQPFRLDIEASQGSVDDINQVLAGKWGFGIAQADMLYKVKNGKGPWYGHPHDQLRAIAALYPESLTIVAAEDADINSVADLKGKKVSVGLPGSSSENNAANFLKFYGLDLQTDLTLVHNDTIDAPEQLQRGFIDAYFYTVGHPNLATREATFGERKVKLIGVTPKMQAEITARLPFVVKTEIPVDYYPALVNKQPVPALGVKAILFTAAVTPDYEVTAILQALLNDFPRFQRQHPAFAKISVKTLPQGVILPLHPAAEAIYRKEGLK